ncbi:MFS transporter [Asticcacaulis biprosthecium]|uniref:MFS transporter n=1 Tax=Asticcacaulis biprosthecium TaxID=76891 RepID=UPI0002F892C6
MLAVVGVCSALVQAGLTGVIVKKIGERKAMYLGLFSGMLAFIGYGLAPTWYWFVATIPLGALWGLATPNIQALMSSKVGPQEQGTLQGANMSLSAMSTVFAPILFGVILSAVTKSGVPMWLSGAAFWMAALFMVFSLILAGGVKQSLTVETPSDGAPH